MAEAVGLAASVLTLAQIGWVVAKGLYNLADEVGSAGEAVRVFANDFRLFVETIKTLGDLFEGSPPASMRIHSTTEELLDVATEQVVKPFQTMLAQLEPLLLKWRDSPRRMIQLGLRLQWAFRYKRKVLFYHSALNALKGNASLLLQAMTLREQNTPHVRFILCTSIEDTKTLLQGGTREQVSNILTPKDVGTTDGCSITLYSEKASESGSTISVIPTRTSSESQDADQLSSETAMIRLASNDNLDDADEIFGGIRLLEPDRINISEQDQAEKEEQLEVSFAIRAVQRKVIKVADEVTNAATPRQTNGNGAGRMTSPDIAESPIAVYEGDRPIYLRDSLDCDFEIPYKLVRTWKVSASLLLDPLLKILEAMHAFLAAEYGQVNPDSLALPIVMKSELPWADGTVAASRRSTDELYDIRMAIEAGSFTVIRVQNEVVSTSGIILPQEWESRVKPGWTLQIKLDDDDLDRIKIREVYDKMLFKRARVALMALVEAESSGVKEKT
ncbi:MAG: hypothetical protein Q9227_005261 [Pyrenula ochraceoflavens]